MTDLAALRFVEVPCALCGSERTRLVAVSSRYAVPLRIVRCRSCRHVYLNPRPADDDLPRLYEEGYYTGEAEEGGYTYGDERRRAEVVAMRARARLEKIESLIRPGRLLEVGCAFGAFLLAARERGWEVSGLDLSEYATAHCRDAGLTVRRGTLLDSSDFAGPVDVAAFSETVDVVYLSETVDVVYLSETVEHLPDPRATVRAAARILDPGGLIVLGTANHDSLARRLRGARWGYYMPGHLQYFTASSLGRLLREEGLPVARRRFGGDRSLASLLAIRRADGRPSGLRGLLTELLLRVHLGPWSLGAGMVLYGRKER